MTTELKVSAVTKVGSLAGAIAGVVREHGETDLHCIGPTALFVGVKAIALAKKYLLEDGHDIYMVPTFFDVLDRDTGEPKTGLNLMVRVFAD